MVKRLWPYPRRKGDRDMKRLFRYLNVVILLGLCGCATAYRQYDVTLNQESSIAERHLSEGNYVGALDSYAKARRAYELENNEQGVLFCLERIGWIQRENGQYGEALHSFRLAHPIGLRLNGDAAEIDADLGDVFLFSGDSQKALEHYHLTLTALKDFVFKTSYSRPPSNQEITSTVRKSKAIIHARTNLGTLHYFAKEYEKSLEHLQAADQLIQRIQTVANHAFYGMFMKLDSDFLEGVGFCHTMTGAVYGEMARFEEARRHFDAGSEAFIKGERPYGLLVNQALRYRVDFISPQASLDSSKLKEYEEFLGRAEKFGALDIVWRMSFEIGRFMAKEKKYPEARAYLVRAVDALEQTRSRLREDTVKKMFASSVQDVYSEIIHVLFEMRMFEEGFDYLERSKARAFLDMLAGRSVEAKKSVDPMLVEKEKGIQQNMDSLATRLRTSKGSERSALAESYRGLVRERGLILESIKAQSLEFAATTTVATVSARKIMDRLGKGSALIAYFVDSKESYIWCLSQGAVTTFPVDMGSEPLAEKVADYRHAVATQQVSDTAEAGKRLTELLIGPILQTLRGVNRLYIVPSMALHYLPFSGLPLPDGRFLTQEYTISILPSGSSLFFLDKQVSADRDSLLALGNPQRKGPEPMLPFAEQEVRAISGNFARNTLRIREDASETLIKERDWTGIGIIHIAAHGRFNSAEPLKSALLLAEGSGNDGDLETFEIFSLRINPRLVVLSACESGLGKLEGGDELQGLNRAFLYAGAGGVVSSLWNVSDQSTFRLMEHFYDLLRSRPAAEALREAQIRLMKEYPSPYHWAPFYLTGGMDF